MKRRFGPCLLAFAAAAVVSVFAQNETPSPPQEQGPKPEYTQVDPGKSLDFLGEAVTRSNLNLGMTVSAAYDTNIAAFSTKTLSQTSYLFAPHIAITQYRPKLGLSVSYDGGLSVYQQLSNSNTYSQTASADVLYQLASHWQAHAVDHYSYSANPFGSYFTIIGQPTLNYPNPVTYVPFAATNQNIAELDIANQLGRNDTLTFNGSESFRRYSNYSNNYTFQAGLLNMISYSGGANYSHKFSARLSAGAGYNFQSLDFNHGQQRSGISSMQFFVNYQLTRSWSVSGWMGPEYVSSKTIIQYLPGRFATLYQNSWSPAGGLNIGWQGLRDSFVAGFSKQVSDGGGLLATTIVYSMNAAYRRKLGPRWDGLASVQYGNNNSFAASNLNRRFFPDRKYTVTQIYGQLNREITPRITASLTYGYVYETQKNIYIVGAAPNYNESRVSASIQYNWNHPLGR
jgi:hypothetical protein